MVTVDTGALLGGVRFTAGFELLSRTGGPVRLVTRGAPVERPSSGSPLLPFNAGSGLRLDSRSKSVRRVIASSEHVGLYPHERSL